MVILAAVSQSPVIALVEEPARTSEPSAAEHRGHRREA
jgi:hypothetical protein